MSSKSYSHFFSKNIRVYAIFNDQSFNNMLTNDIVSFEQLGLDHYGNCCKNLNRKIILRLLLPILSNEANEKKQILQKMAV